MERLDRTTYPAQVPPTDSDLPGAGAGSELEASRSAARLHLDAGRDAVRRALEGVSSADYLRDARQRGGQ